MKYINKIGVELEGGWLKPPDGVYPDGSVRVFSQGCDRANCGLQFCVRCTGRRPNSYVDGEVCSPPLTLKQIKLWIEDHIPERVNSTCGTHVHISLKNTQFYSKLMERPFFDYFNKWMKDWGKLMKYPEDHPFWIRLSGSNGYCRAEFNPNAQIDLREKSNIRRTQLNFCWSFHGTIECRLFHGFTDPEEAFSAVKSYVDCVESYLNSVENIPLPNIEVIIPIKEVDPDLIGVV